MRRCENCGQVAGPRFCPHCGQEVEPRRGPLLEVFSELVSEWLSFDSRLLRSLRALGRPGRLSELYLAGKRAPFLRPFRLYLLASVVLFSTLLTLEPPDEAGLNIYIGGELVISPATRDDQRDFQILTDAHILLQNPQARLLRGRHKQSDRLDLCGDILKLEIDVPP